MPSLVNHPPTHNPGLDEVNKLELAFTYKSETADAHRSVGNHHLDAECTDFGRDMDHELKGDHKHPRWIMFFLVAVSTFIRQAFAAQVARVRGWLAGAKDPLLEKHAPPAPVATTYAPDAGIPPFPAPAAFTGAGTAPPASLNAGVEHDDDDDYEHDPVKGAVESGPT